MPVSVKSTLQESLAASAEPAHQLLQTQIASATKHLVLKTVEYEEYPENFLSQNDALKAKYILLSANDKGSANGGLMVVKKTLTSPASQNGTNGTDTATTNGNGGGPPTTPKKEHVNKNELPLPKRTLFPRDKVQIGWNGSDRKWNIGAGFVNIGNTCYLNSALQALLHVPALANWLVSDTEHREQCCSEFNDICIICAVSKTLLLSQASSTAVRPWCVYSRLKQICKHLVAGRQEDAHEFLRYLIEACEKAYLQRFSKAHLANMDQYSKETTPLNQILGGYLRSSVRCLSCNHISITFQHFEDLLLDIRKANTIDDALQSYFSREKLEDMGYNCEGCKKKVTATKQFSLERPPVVLCIQLKRFSMQGTKLNKQVSIKPKLDLSAYVRKSGGSGGQALNYRLVSMVTHLGSSQHCGHYTAIGLTESGTYYQFDDSSVHPISLQHVLQTNAYIIFYELENSGMYRHVLANGGTSATWTNGNHSSSLPATITLKTNSLTKHENGNGLSHSKCFIGPVLPPNHATASRESLANGISNGESLSGSSSKNGMSNGHSGESSAKLNMVNKQPGTGNMFRKYPSAELLFKSPTKQGGDKSLSSPNGKPATGASGLSQQQMSPKSLVPYNSHLSSDEDEKDDEDLRTVETKHQSNRSADGAASIPSPVKNGGHTPYINSNSGPFKVCNSNPENGVAKGALKSVVHQNGSNKVLNELLKQDHNAYGGVAVNTWTGQKSNLDKESSAEKSLKRQSDRKLDDEEIDRGHTKKIKLLDQKVGRDNPGFNAFQEYQNKQHHQNQQGASNGNYQPWVHNGQSYKSNQYRHHNHNRHRHGANNNHANNSNNHHHQRPSPFHKRSGYWPNKKNGGGGRGFNNYNGRKPNGGGAGGGFRRNN